MSGDGDNYASDLNSFVSAKNNKPRPFTVELMNKPPQNRCRRAQTESRNREPRSAVRTSGWAMGAVPLIPYNLPFL
jgi:hypothetical protein